MEKKQLLEIARILEESIASDCDSIQDLIYHWNISDLIKHLNRECDAAVCLTVTDLVYCSQKHYYRLQHPLPMIESNIYAAWAAYGRLIHLGIETLLLSHWRDSFYIEKEVEKKLFIELGGEKKLVKISGRIDALRILGNGETIVYEFKSSRGDSEQPKPSHVLQVRTYMNMVGARKGVLVYINPDRISEYSIETPLSDYELVLLVKETLENIKHPRWDWECNYCIYSMMCPWKRINSYSKKR